MFRIQANPFAASKIKKIYPKFKNRVEEIAAITEFETLFLSCQQTVLCYGYLKKIALILHGDIEGTL
jgi:hypothetical protein